MTGAPGDAYDGADFYCDVALPRLGELEVVEQTEHAVAFHHTRPSWPVHVVVFPRRHLRSLTTLTAADEPVVRDLLALVQRVAAQVEREHGAARVLTNLGDYQDSRHLHVHVISGPEHGASTDWDALERATDPSDPRLRDGDDDRVAAYVAEHAAGIYGGSYLTDTERVVLLTDDLVRHERALRASVDHPELLVVRQAEHRLQELEDVVEALGEAADELADAGIDLQLWAVAEERNRVEVLVRGLTAAMRAALLERFGPCLEVAEGEVRALS